MGTGLWHFRLNCNHETPRAILRNPENRERGHFGPPCIPACDKRMLEIRLQAKRNKHRQETKLDHPDLVKNARKRIYGSLPGG